MKYKLMLLVLVIGLVVSLGFNLYLYTLPTKIEPTYVANVQLTDFNWTEYAQSTGLYYVTTSVTLVNSGNSSAAVVMTYSVCDPNGNVIHEFFTTGSSQGVYREVYFTDFYIIHPEQTNYYGLSFCYQKPQNTSTYVKAEITEVYEIST